MTYAIYYTIPANRCTHIIGFAVGKEKSNRIMDELNWFRAINDLPGTIVAVQWNN